MVHAIAVRGNGMGTDDERLQRGIRDAMKRVYTPRLLAGQSQKEKADAEGEAMTHSFISTIRCEEINRDPRESG
jgi:hypothetical protein